VIPGQTFTALVEQQLAALGDSESAATLLEVLPARETLPAPPVEALSTPTYLPYLITALVLLAGFLLAIWYFFL
jgi:hypothetical protein